MKHILSILILIACLSSMSFAMWLNVPLDELVQDSDLVVIGTLRDVSEYSKDDVDYGQGIISVDEVLWGDVAPADSLTLKWQNASAIICPRLEHKYNENKKGIWLLTIENGGEVRANYPGRFVGPGKRKKVERLLREKKVCLRTTKYALSSNEAIRFSVVFRNATQNQLSFPGLEYHDGYLYLSPDIDLVLHRGDGERLKQAEPLRNRVIVSDTIAPIVVEPGQEFRVNINLRDLFDIMTEEYYSLQLRVKGHDPANMIWFYAEAPKSSDIDGPYDNDQNLTGAKGNSTTKLGVGSAMALAGLFVFVVTFVSLRHRNT